jgi:predicted ArsR family transcriptional regulator
MSVSDRDVSGLGSLAEPVRRELYDFVCAQEGPVSRDRAADELGIARHQAKFHLDRLEQAGLLDAVYARPDGRGGPGAGRPAKLYRRASREIAVTLPERRYELAGQLMAEAIAATADGGHVLDVLDQVAAAHGAAVAAEGVQAGGDAVEDLDDLDAAVAVLAGNGYEPRRAGDEVVMVNCPFHGLAQTHTELVCRMNHGVLAAMATTLGADLEARLDPGPGRCCVVLHRTRRRRGRR